ncbi:MAG: TetR/AcrR family transcriptional regulator [Cohaesibacter sp.]|nr:TetR/AcrR family transcriptional regulator [Cohaesibacter sp.]
MQAKTREQRQEEILEAAFEVLAEKGYRRTSMLSIAKKAKASNQTLYRWYGSKEALFSSVVKANARQAIEMLEKNIHIQKPIDTTLIALGEALLLLLTSKRAVLLNRAAAADASETGRLGQTIAEFGRSAVRPLLMDYLQRAADNGELSFDETGTLEEAAETYFYLLIGDIQIRRVIGVLDVLSQRDANARSKRASAHFLLLFGAQKNF